MRISLHFQKKHEWLRKSIEKEKDKRNSPSLNNTVESILVEYFKKK
jgi:hypothetical protein